MWKIIELMHTILDNYAFIYVPSGVDGPRYNQSTKALTSVLCTQPDVFRWLDKYDSEQL